MDIYGDHALLCCGDVASAGFQLRHRVVQQSLGTILRQAGIFHVVEPPHLRLTRDDAPTQVMALGRPRLLTSSSILSAVILTVCVDLVGVLHAWSGWRDAASALPSVEKG